MVRESLAAAIESMNGEARRASAITVSSGVFVPLEHFRRGGIDTQVLLRALGEVGMAAVGSSDRARTVEHELDGRQQVGVILKPAFVEGLDASHFVGR